jgi:hypothetical protein
VLIDAGASRDGEWLSGSKATGDEIAELLRDYGVRLGPVGEQPESASDVDLGQADLALGGLERGRRLAPAGVRDH